MGDNTNGLYVAWCTKEAIYKWNGEKGLEFKKHIHMKPFKLKESGCLEALVELNTGVKALNVNYFKNDDGYMLAYVVA